MTNRSLGDLVWSILERKEYFVYHRDSHLLEYGAIFGLVTNKQICYPDDRKRSLTNGNGIFVFLLGMTENGSFIGGLKFTQIYQKTKQSDILIGPIIDSVFMHLKSFSHRK